MSIWPGPSLPYNFYSSTIFSVRPACPPHLKWKPIYPYCFCIEQGFTFEIFVTIVNWVTCFNPKRVCLRSFKLIVKGFCNCQLGIQMWKKTAIPKNPHNFLCILGGVSWYTAIFLSWGRPHYPSDIRNSKFSTASLDIRAFSFDTLYILCWL